MFTVGGSRRSRGWGAKKKRLIATLIISQIFVLCGGRRGEKTGQEMLCLHYSRETVHYSTKDAHSSVITFLALEPCPRVEQALIDKHWRAHTVSLPQALFSMYIQYMQANIFVAIFTIIFPRVLYGIWEQGKDILKYDQNST